MNRVRISCSVPTVYHIIEQFKYSDALYAESLAPVDKILEMSILVFNSQPPIRRAILLVGMIRLNQGKTNLERCDSLMLMAEKLMAFYEELAEYNGLREVLQLTITNMSTEHRYMRVIMEGTKYDSPVSLTA